MPLRYGLFFMSLLSFFFPAYPVQQSYYPWPSYQVIINPVLSGEIHERNADHDGYDSLARQDKHGSTGEEKKDADKVPGNEYNFEMCIFCENGSQENPKKCL